MKKFKLYLDITLALTSLVMVGYGAFYLIDYSRITYGNDSFTSMLISIGTIGVVVLLLGIGNYFGINGPRCASNYVLYTKLNNSNNVDVKRDILHCLIGVGFIARTLLSLTTVWYLILLAIMNHFFDISLDIIKPPITIAILTLIDIVRFRYNKLIPLVKVEVRELNFANSELCKIFNKLAQDEWSHAISIEDMPGTSINQKSKYFVMLLEELNTHDVYYKIITDKDNCLFLINFAHTSTYVDLYAYGNDDLEAVSNMYTQYILGKSHPGRTTLRKNVYNISTGEYTITIAADSKKCIENFRTAKKLKITKLYGRG